MSQCRQSRGCKCEPIARIIRTEHVYPPVPSRKYDWRATFDGYDPGDAMGAGATEAEAVANLLIESDYEGPVEIKRW